MKITDIIAALVALDQAFAHLINLVKTMKGTLTAEDEAQLQAQVKAIRTRNDTRYKELQAHFKGV